MKHWYVVVLSVVAMVALLAGCGSTGTVSSTKSPAASTSATNQFLQGLKDGSSSVIKEASATLSAAVEKGTPARDALEKALDFSLSGEGAD